MNLKRLAFHAFLVVMARVATGRSLRGTGSELASDGMSSSWGSSVLGLGSTTVTCTPTYGFLPCTTELWGELFLIVVYEVLLSVAGKYLTQGSDLFFQMFGTGIFGASLFQMLGTIPQMIIMLVSTLSSDSDTIETMTSMSMAMLAGSAIMSLTIVWGSVVVFGSHDLSSPDSISGTATGSSSTTSSFNFQEIAKNSFNSNFGVRTDVDTKLVARLLILVSMIPFLILQLAEILSSSTAKRIVVLITLIITVILLVAYCTYEVFKPWVQEKRYELIVRRYVEESLLQKYLTSSGKPNAPLIKDLFNKIDKNNNKQISETELYAFILGIQIEEVGMSTDDFTQKVMKQFDTSNNTQISESEFVKGMSNWLIEARDDLPLTASSSSNKATSKGNTEEQQSLISQDKSGASSSTTTTASATTAKPAGKAWWNYTKALFLIILGTGVTMLIGMPLMVSVQDFASSANIPSFLVSYVVIPLAMSYRQVIMAVEVARKKTVKDISLALSQIYNGIFMNNVMGVAIFLALVYIKDISWDVSAEVLVVLLICTLMGLVSSFLTKFPFWLGIVAYVVYFISLLLLYLLTEVWGWA